MNEENTGRQREKGKAHAPLAEAKRKSGAGIKNSAVSRLGLAR
jgi:hypothetical protein